VYPDFQKKIAPESIAAYMQYGYIPAPYSIYAHVYKLLPGTYITDNTPLSLPEPIPYWSALAVAQKGIDAPLKINDQDATQQLDHRLGHIIRERMVADVPMGAFLSGGIDSSLVTALMQAHSNTPVKTFTIGFNESGFNEATYAKAVARHLKTEHTELYVEAHDALSVIPQLPTIYAEPFADSSAIPTLLVSKLASQQIKVVLSGDGGDELFGGYNRYLWGQTLLRHNQILPHAFL
jgi:asparagine synthase (glutamine-hydrolysing)